MSQPSPSTVKRLFAVSGNLCAFPHCSNSLVDPETGKVTGRICHIKARKPNGPRYDPEQTDMERHAFENLMLMCPIHHDVIDSDTDSYTVRRLQEIKAEHEAQNADGHEPSNETALQLLANLELSADIALTAADHSRINWVGDALPGGTKIVVGPVGTTDDKHPDGTADIDKLIVDIQTALYGDNGRLPYVLTLCMDLCGRVSLSEQYGQWLKRELTGYGDYYRLRGEFEDEERLQSWMERWASHRLVETYAKVLNRPPQGRPEIKSFPYERVLVPYPLAEIARMIQNHRERGEQEF